MKDRWNRIHWDCLLGLILLLIPACQDTAFPDAPEVPDTPDKERTGMVSFRVKLDDPALETRWEGSMSEDTGTSLENEVCTVRLVLYGNDGNKWVVRYVYDFNIRSKDRDGDGNWDFFEQYDIATSDKDHLYSADEKGFVTYARLVKWDDYKLLLIINPTKKGTTPAAGVTSAHDLYEVTALENDLTDLYKAVGYSYQTQADYDNLMRVKENCGPASVYMDNGKHGYFLMTNHQDLIDISSTPVNSQIYDSEEEANKHPVEVSVSRIVAKATVRKGDLFAVLPSGATVNTLKWDLDVINKKTYWMRKMTNLIAQAGVKGDMETTAYDWRMGNNRMALYAEDPNFADWYVNNTGDLDNNFLYRSTEYKSSNNGLTPTLTKDVAENKASGPTSEYCLENTLDEQAIRPEVTTRALISCNYVPSGFTASESYFAYNNLILKRSDVIGYAANPAIIPIALSGLSEAIDYVKGKGIVFSDQGLTESFQWGGLGYYQGGINYYKVPIRHTGDSGGTFYGYYGMVRNHHYIVEINNINGPGSPTIKGEDNGYIAVTVKINDWKNRQQNNTIGW